MAGIQRGRLRDLGRCRAAARRPALPTPRQLRAAAPARRLDSWLAEQDADLSRSQAGRLLRDGKVRLNGREARAADAVAAGDLIEYEVPQPAPAAPQPEAIPLEVVYQDEDLVVVDKPAGLVVHPAPGHPSGTLVHALLGLGGSWSTAGGAARPGIVHRLDAGTTGLLLAARSDPAHRSLAAQLADRSLSRTYLAIALGRFKAMAGVLEGPIARDPRNRKRMAVVEGGRFARTRYRRLEQKPAAALVECELDTGRTHQVRVHLAALGHPLAGDRLYGGARAAAYAERPMLHAYRLRLRHPRTNQEITFETPPPTDFTTLWQSL
ncbi:MAG TPA: RluA family pseudouridine synthase [Candidatus Dormibacteraeota bacterium]